MIQNHSVNVSCVYVMQPLQSFIFVTIAEGLANCMYQFIVHYHHHQGFDLIIELTFCVLLLSDPSPLAPLVSLH